MKRAVPPAPPAFRKPPSQPPKPNPPKLSGAEGTQKEVQSINPSVSTINVERQSIPQVSQSHSKAEPALPKRPPVKTSEALPVISGSNLPKEDANAALKPSSQVSVLSASHNSLEDQLKLVMEVRRKLQDSLIESDGQGEQSSSEAQEIIAPAEALPTPAVPPNHSEGGTKGPEQMAQPIVQVEESSSQESIPKLAEGSSSEGKEEAAHAVEELHEQKVHKDTTEAQPQILPKRQKTESSAVQEFDLENQRSLHSQQESQRMTIQETKAVHPSTIEFDQKITHFPTAAHQTQRAKAMQRPVGSNKPSPKAPQQEQIANPSEQVRLSQPQNIQQTSPASPSIKTHLVSLRQRFQVLKRESVRELTQLEDREQAYLRRILELRGKLEWQDSLIGTLVHSE